MYLGCFFLVNPLGRKVIWTVQWKLEKKYTDKVPKYMDCAVISRKGIKIGTTFWDLQAKNG